MNIGEELERYLPKTIEKCDDKDIYYALLELINKLSHKRKENESKKKLYYISAEFLIGKLLSNNLINLGIYEDVKNYLAENGKSLSQIEDTEPEPSLGNGGLGRLAACFMDSIATLGLNGDGIGLLYHCGLFRQYFEKNLQQERPDFWLENKNWIIPTDKKYPVKLGGKTFYSKMYDILVTGYGGNVRNLHLFDLETTDESIIKDGIKFDKKNVDKNLTLFLYPDDSDEDGRLLRIYQQYFMVSSAAQLIIEECEARGCKLYDLPEYAVIQINDTHPAMIIPELVRLLCEKGLDTQSAITAVRNTCAYTNHTILAEALEKWQIDSLKKAVPQLVPVIELLDKKIRAEFGDESVYIIDSSNRVHMAHMAIHYGFSINGVASLHTDILKSSELSMFYKIYPEKFNNKTNGITFRRWLLKSNPSLTEFIEQLIGDGFKKDASQLKNLLKFKDDQDVLEKLIQIKENNKRSLTEYLLKTQGASVNENSIFDIQIKRLHEYKRQQLNMLYLINKFLEIKDGKKPPAPITAIFGAKAAPAYNVAKNIIHLILCMAQAADSDPDVRGLLKIVMTENYNVTKAERLIPACDISEQISLASKEASGTGNMKLMLNGAVTLGTEDGANVEIHRLVGDENIYIFGASSEEVIEKQKSGKYNPLEYYKSDSVIKRTVDFITSDYLAEFGDKNKLQEIKKDLTECDRFMTLLDFREYIDVKDTMIHDYTDRLSWAKKMLVNISCAGYFSSDRTISEYNRDIWHLEYPCIKEEVK